MLIKVNGYTINPDKVGMLKRTEGTRHLDGGKSERFSGITIVFAAGNSRFIEDPEGREIEDAFEHYDGKAYSELPY